MEIYNWIIDIKGESGLYKPVGGAVASLSTIFNRLHIRVPFSKLGNTYK